MTENSISQKRPGAWHSPERVAEIVETVTQHTEPLCANLGLELVYIEFQRETAGRILRIYIDKEAGISLDDCATVSQRLSDILDVAFADDEVGPYSLEVTSPGSERPLSTLANYERFSGRMAKIRLKEAVNNQKNYRGKLIGVKDGAIIIETNQITVEIPFAAIARARLVTEDGEL